VMLSYRDLLSAFLYHNNAVVLMEPFLKPWRHPTRLPMPWRSALANVMSRLKLCKFFGYHNEQCCVITFL